MVDAMLPTADCATGEHGASSTSLARRKRLTVSIAITSARTRRFPKSAALHTSRLVAYILLECGLHRCKRHRLAYNPQSCFMPVIGNLYAVTDPETGTTLPDIPPGKMHLSAILKDITCKVKEESCDSTRAGNTSGNSNCLTLLLVDITFWHSASSVFSARE